MNSFVGQVVGTMNQPKSAAQLVFMLDELIDAVQHLGAQLDG